MRVFFCIFSPSKSGTCKQNEVLHVFYVAQVWQVWQSLYVQTKQDYQTASALAYQTIRTHAAKALISARKFDRIGSDIANSYYAKAEGLKMAASVLRKAIEQA